ASSPRLTTACPCLVGAALGGPFSPAGRRRLGIWPQGTGPPMPPLFGHGRPGCPSERSPTPPPAPSANTTLPGCAPTGPCDAAASGACLASAAASAPAAPSVPAGRPPGGTPPPSVARPSAPHAAPAAPPPASVRTPSPPAWLP